jgi:hypothetical protein
MTVKEIRILLKQLKYLRNYEDRISDIRQITKINPSYTFEREEETIKSLYETVLHERTLGESNLFFASTSGWTVEYLREENGYKDNEDFKIRIYFSFVQSDNFD